jgi:putative transposase
MHVIQRGAHRARMFHDTGDYEVFLEFLRQSAEKHDAEVHGVMLMPNHVHLIVTPRHNSSLPRTMQQIGRWYVPHFNRKYGHVGALWQGRYRAIPIDTEKYWLTCLRYVEQNPVRAGMVAAPGEYRWSTYHAHARGKWSDWLTPHPVYLALGDTPAEREACYRVMCGDGLSDPDLSALRYAVHHGWAYGSPTFAAMIEATHGQRAAPRAAAGPCPQI